MGSGRPYTISQRPSPRSPFDRRVTRLAEHPILSSELFTHRRRGMSIISHLRTWLKVRPKFAGSKARQARYRPLVEALEDRCLPSTASLTPASVSAAPIFNEDFNQAVGSLPLKSTWTYNNGSD